MKLFSREKEHPAHAAPRKRRRRPSRWTARQKWRAAARVGDAAVTTVGDVLRLVLRILISALLILICTGLLFACIFAYYVKTELNSKLKITLEDASMDLSSTPQLPRRMTRFAPKTMTSSKVPTQAGAPTRAWHSAIRCPR